MRRFWCLSGVSSCYTYGMTNDQKNPVKVAAGRAGAQTRWGDTPRVVRLHDLTPEQRRLVLALVEAQRESNKR